MRSTASDYYQKSLAKDPSNFNAWQNFLNLDLELRRWDSLAMHSENALELFPNQAFIYLFAGIGFTQIKQYEEAVSYLELGKKLVTNNPQLLNSFYNSLGDTYNALGDHENSDKSYDAAIALNPNDDIALNNYSYYLSLRKEELEKARKMVEGVIQRNPDNPTYLDTYAWVLYQLEEYSKAKEVMELVIRNNEASAVNYDHYGDILYKLGDVNGAVANWQKAKSLNGNLENINKKIAKRMVIE
jgi:tetratricopeptide (TPR) repeat protein